MIQHDEGLISYDKDKTLFCVVNIHSHIFSMLLHKSQWRELNCMTLKLLENLELRIETTMWTELHEWWGEVQKVFLLWEINT